MGESKRDSATRGTYRRMNSSGHITRCVVPSCQGAAQLVVQPARLYVTERCVFRLEMVA
jgi:hypothetical protein